jgi:hypothetical protein
VPLLFSCRDREHGASTRTPLTRLTRPTCRCRSEPRALAASSKLPFEPSSHPAWMIHQKRIDSQDYHPVNSSLAWSVHAGAVLGCFKYTATDVHARVRTVMRMRACCRARAPAATVASCRSTHRSRLLRWPRGIERCWTRRGKGRGARVYIQLRWRIVHNQRAGCSGAGRVFVC